MNINKHKETIKTVALTLLIGLIIGFISGVKAQSTVTEQLTGALKLQVAQPVTASK